MVNAKKFIYAQPFDGMPKEEDFKIVDEELPPLKDGEFLAEAIYLSVDPYMRVYTSKLPIGSTMIGSQVGRIIDSKNKEFPIGKFVVGHFGWRTHSISDGTFKPGDFPTYLVPKLEGYPLSVYLGILGMTGNTAYFGLLEICRPKAGETVVVTGAAGGVGSQVGQIAKLKGCKVIGIAGSDEKSDWLKSIGFDHVINYKTDDVKTALQNAAPDGVDCYFDNVGGEISSTVIYQMRRYGRVAVCGAISSYNDQIIPKATALQSSIVMNQLMIQGLLVVHWTDRWQEGIKQNTEWLLQGKLKYQETVTEGFENMTKALVGILKGANVGKAVVKV